MNNEYKEENKERRENNKAEKRPCLALYISGGASLSPGLTRLFKAASGIRSSIVRDRKRIRSPFLVFSKCFGIYWICECLVLFLMRRWGKKYIPNCGVIRERNERITAIVFCFVFVVAYYCVFVFFLLFFCLFFKVCLLFVKLVMYFFLSSIIFLFFLPLLTLSIFFSSFYYPLFVFSLVFSHCFFLTSSCHFLSGFLFSSFS